MLIKIVLPVLIVLYPIVVVLIVVSLLDPWLKDHNRIMLCGMLFVFPFSLLDGLKNAGILLPGISAWASSLPLFNLGLGWLIPAIICLLYTSIDQGVLQSGPFGSIWFVDFDTTRPRKRKCVLCINGE